MVNTQFLLIDTKTWNTVAYDGKQALQVATIEVDAKSDPEQLKEVLEGFRTMETKESMDIRKQAAQVQKALVLRFAYADLEVASWKL